jgi:hypothetical protein
MLVARSQAETRLPSETYSIALTTLYDAIRRSVAVNRYSRQLSPRIRSLKIDLVWGAEVELTSLPRTVLFAAVHASGCGPS